MQFELDHSAELADLATPESDIRKTTPTEVKIQKKLMKKGVTAFENSFKE